MTPELWMLVMGGLAALIFGPRTARSSERREPIYGGTTAKTLNLIASCLFTAVPVVVLTGLITGFGWRSIIVALTMIGTSLLVTFAYGWVETPARANAPKRGITNTWTEQDARSSGL
ncbi:MAG: hypothetical protein MUF38_15405 [Anaerolineae bacterium]|nr:hypothetical protein [Anaerolineae bacterium]